ncbi:hypothetical protein DFJ74DRAFT_131379 [Hyaloraphidium curvatum]|nr:hypothetical protein DFJ74DRAFT_131379 [Hyaloraphidium curvatum]
MKRKRPASQWIVEDLAAAPSSATSEAISTARRPKSARKGREDGPTPLELFHSAATSDSQEPLEEAIKALSRQLKDEKIASTLLSPTLNPAFLLHLCLVDLAARKDHSSALPLLQHAKECFPTGIAAYERLAHIKLFSADTEGKMSEVIVLLERAVELGRQLAAGAHASDVERAFAELDDPEALEAELEQYEGLLLSHATAAAQKLALVLAGGYDDADGTKTRKLLRGMNYTYRLGRGVLEYPLPVPHVEPGANSEARRFVRVLDGILTEPMLEFLGKLFGRESDFWTSHGYNPFSSTGYFSYLEPLDRLADGAQKQSRMFSTIVSHLAKTATALFPHLFSGQGARPLTTAEWWAHSRPHSSGHQLHFDSENEGITPLETAHGSNAPRHPVVSCIVFLSPDPAPGGPTLMTDQTLATKDLDDVKGWLAYGKRGRVAFFDARYLHGVIPGRMAAEMGADARRATFMVGLWDKVAKQEPRPDGKLGGASQAFPPKYAEGKDLDWVRLIAKTPAEKPAAVPVVEELDHLEQPVVAVEGKVWERLTRPPKDKRGSVKDIAAYEDCFQGF